MFGKRAIVTLVLGLLAFGYLFWLNPQEVDFQLYPSGGKEESEAGETSPASGGELSDGDAAPFSKVRTSFALILFLFFLAGIAVGSFMAAFREAARSFTIWRRNKRDRRRETARHLLNQGRGLAVLGRTKTARKLVQRAYRKDPGESPMALEVARIEIADGEFRNAEGRLKRLLAADPENPEMLALLLDLYRARNDFEGQLATLSRWLEADPDHLPTLKALRDLYRQAANWSEAVRIQERVLAQAEGRRARSAEQRTLTELRYRHALALRPVPSRNLLLRLVREDEGFAPAHLTLGETQLTAGDAEGAEQTWIRGYHATGQVGLLLRAEVARAKEGRTEEMLKLYRKLGKKSGAPALLEARLLLSLERSQEALKALEEDTPTSPLGTLGRALLGEALFRLRSYDDAARAFRETIFGPVGEIPLVFACRSCNQKTPRWTATCPSCEACDTLELDTETVSAPAALPALP